MYLIRKWLSPLEGVPTGLRFAPGGGVQVTPDGGETWVDDPASDARFNPAYIKSQTGTTRCSIAWGMAVALEQFLVNMILSPDVAKTATNGLGYLIGFLPSLGWAYQLPLEVAEAILEEGQAAVAAAFTSEVAEQLRCIFYCNMPANKQLTQAAWDEILIDVADDIGDSVVTATLEAWYKLLGFVGITNGAIVNDQPGADCSECACDWCYEVLLSELPKDGITYQLNFGYGQQSACGLETTAAGASQIINAQVFFPAAVLDSLEFEYTTGAVKGTASRQWQIRNNSLPQRSGGLDTGIGSWGMGQFLINVECDEFWFSLDTQTSGGLTNCGVKLRLRGPGPNPFPDSNC